MDDMKAIPGPVVDQIINRLDHVAQMLRALREMAINAECMEERGVLRELRKVDNSMGEYEALAISARGMSEYAHLLLDSCIRRLGRPGLGNFDYDAWNEQPGAGGR